MTETRSKTTEKHYKILYAGFDYLSLILLAVGAGIIYAASSPFHRRWRLCSSAVAIVKIERDPANPCHLVTVRGAGYRLDRGSSSLPGSGA